MFRKRIQLGLIHVTITNTLLSINRVLNRPVPATAAWKVRLIKTGAVG